MTNKPLIINNGVYGYGIVGLHVISTHNLLRAGQISCYVKWKIVFSVIQMEPKLSVLNILKHLLDCETFKSTKNFIFVMQ